MDQEQKQTHVILIPVYNGRDSVCALIRTLRTISRLPIMLVDDGSVDGLGDNPPRVEHFLRHEKNLGKGAALHTGLSAARKLGYEFAVTLDADGQHDPLVIPEFVRASSGFDRAPFLVGRRDFRKESMPFHRRFSNFTTSLMLSLRTGRRIYDSQVGYRCYPLNDSRLWDSSEPGFQFESDVFLRAARMRIPLGWISVPVIYGTQGSHMHLVKDTLRFVRTYLRSFQC